MEVIRKYTSCTFKFQSNYQPEQIWEYLVHPKYQVGFTKSPCYYNEIENSFSIEKGKSWKEIHTGEDCKGDIVTCKITDVDVFNSFKSVRIQSGIKNKTIMTLTKNSKGTIISEQQKFSLSLKKFSLMSLFAWLMLGTGLLVKFSLTTEDNEFWFKKLEQKLASEFAS